MSNLIFPFTYKIILIGSSAVGKTSLCHNLRGEMFSDKIPITIGVDFMKFKLKDESRYSSRQGKIYDIQLWDTAGHEKFRTITKSYYRDSHIILLCFDLTNRKSFMELDMWMDEIQENANNPIICLLGLKSDLEPVIGMEEIEQFLIRNVLSKYNSFSSKNSPDSKAFKDILINLLQKYDILIEDNYYFNKLREEQNYTNLCKKYNEEYSEEYTKNRCC